MSYISGVGWVCHLSLVLVIVHLSILTTGATNRPQDLDEAARRRMVKRLYIPLPDDQARLAIIQQLLRHNVAEITEEQMQVYIR